MARYLNPQPTSFTLQFSTRPSSKRRLPCAQSRRPKGFWEYHISYMLQLIIYNIWIRLAVAVNNPSGNSFAEAFNAWVKAECLNARRFSILDDAWHKLGTGDANTASTVRTVPSATKPRCSALLHQNRPAIPDTRRAGPSRNDRTKDGAKPCCGNL